jgi:crotonobetainyl-CoA:carnitine CoA-transferase CaiB-like acyl-CoA transferase
VTDEGGPAPGPLQGVRIVEVASEHGALAGKILADLGAEVVVVEPPGGHPSRWFEPFSGDVAGPERSLWWWYYNAGKQSVALDLDEPDGASLFADLVQSSDLVLEGERPGRLAEIGLDYEGFAGDQPELVWVSITPFGRASPRSCEPMTDLTLQAGAGPVWSCGYDDHRLPPVRPGGNQGYHTACLWAVEAAMVALYVQWTQGVGQLVDVSMHAACNVTTEAATYEWLVAQATVQRYTFRHAAVRETPPRLMTAMDGRTVIGALPRRSNEFRALCEWLVDLDLVDQFEEFFFLESGVVRGGVQIPEVGTDPEAAAIYQAGSDALRLVAAHLPAATFFLEAQQRGIPAAVLAAPEEVLSDPHFVARGFPTEIFHEDLGRTFVYPGPVFRAPASPWRVGGRAPHLDEHGETARRDARGELRQTPTGDSAPVTPRGPSAAEGV